MARPNKVPTWLWAVLVVAMGVTLVAFALQGRSRTMIPIGSPLDPNLGVANPAAVKDLNLRAQADHPVTAEMQAAANELGEAPAPDFDLPGNDGTRHTLASLTAGKPLLIFFVEKNCPCCLGAKFFVDKMIDLYPGVLNAVGIINAEGEIAQAWERATKPRFLVLQDPRQKVIRAYKAERGVYTTLIAPGGKIVKAYPGYSLDTLKELSGSIAKLAGVPAKEFESRAAPKTLTSGCLFPDPEEPQTENPS